MKGIEQRLNEIEKRLDIIENSTREKNLEIARDELWNVFVKIMKAIYTICKGLHVQTWGLSFAHQAELLIPAQLLDA